jgi:uncharacterized protein YhfF
MGARRQAVLGRVRTAQVAAASFTAAHHASSLVLPQRVNGVRIMYSDGDGTVSLQEFQAAHERIFKAMGEIQAFMHGTRRSAPRQ